MQFEPLTSSDFDYLKEFEPPGWGDLVPRFDYCIKSSFCKPIKLKLKNKIVAIGTTILHKDSAWLASIIVHPNERNKGFGSAITQKLIDTIDTRFYTTIYLDATDLGYPVYKKSGFELETVYAHLKSEVNISGLKLSESIVPYHDKYFKPILELDKKISCEQRQDTISEHLADAKLYVDNNRLEGFYLPALGNGLIVAENNTAGIELMKWRLENNYFAVLPEANSIGLSFLKSMGLIQFRISRRMYMGKKRDCCMDRIYNRISGQLG